MDIPQANSTKKIGRTTRWSLYLGILVWFADLNIFYALASVACEWNWFPIKIAGKPGLVLVEALITLVSLALISFLIYLPWRHWRANQTEKPTDNPQLLRDTEKDRYSLMSFVAMLANSFFFLFIIASFVPMLALNACARG